MAHKLRDVAEVERLLEHLNVLLHEPLPPNLPDELVERVEFIRHCVWWVLNDQRGADFGHLVQAWDAATAKWRRAYKN